MKIDFKNISSKYLTPENKKKLIFGGIILVVVGGFLFLTTNSDDKAEKKSEDFNLPDSEAQRYNTKTEALTNGRTEAETTDLGEYYKNDSIKMTDIDYQQLDNQIAGIQNGSNSNVQNTPQSSYSPPPQQNSSRSSGASGNSHNVYGDYDMWQSKEPSNSRIGYSNKFNTPNRSTTATPVKKTSPKYEVVENDNYQAPPPTIQNYEVPIAKSSNSLAKIRAKMITQGYASNGKSISFVLLEPTTIAGKKTKKGQIIIGIAKEDRNRLSVSFSEIKMDNQRYPAQMQLVGFDGLKGLPISYNDVNQNGTPIKDRAVNETTSRIPVVGGIISSATSGRKSESKLKLGENIECTILIYN